MLRWAVVLLCVSAGTALACPAPVIEAAIQEDTRPLELAILISIAFGLVRVFLQSHAAQRNYHARTQKVGVELALVRRVARDQRTRYALLAGAYLAASAGIAMLEGELAARILLLVLPVTLFTSALAAVWRLHRIAALAPDPDIAARYDGHYVFIARDGRLERWLTAWPRTLERASQLPTAVAVSLRSSARSSSRTDSPATPGSA